MEVTTKIKYTFCDQCTFSVTCVVFEITKQNGWTVIPVYFLTCFTPEWTVVIHYLQPNLMETLHECHSSLCRLNTMKWFKEPVYVIWSTYMFQTILVICQHYLQSQDTFNYKRDPQLP